MPKRIKGVWGEKPQIYKKSIQYTRRQKVKKPVKNADVSDGGGELLIVFVIFLFFLIIVLVLW